MIPIPRLGVRTTFEAGVALALIAALVTQTVRIDGLTIWPIHVVGFIAKLEATQKNLAQTKAAFDQTVAGYRAAAAQARAADAANAARVKSEQAAINERTADEYQTRIAAARAHAQRLRYDAAAAADSGDGRAAPVPRLSTPASGTAQAPGENRLSDSDKLTATEQAIQLDELIKWVRAQAAVEANDPPRKP